MSKRVLIVEDDVMLAIDLAEQLSDLGYVVIGPCMSSDHALHVLDEKGCDVAVLDISLGAETSEPVALELGKADVPFVVASGYSIDQWPPVFKGKAAVNKPYAAKDVAELIEKVA